MENLIKKSRKSFTTLATLKVLLDDYMAQLQAGNAYLGLSIPGITSAYEAYQTRFGRREQFYGSYVQRHCRAGDLFVEENNRYKIRPEHVEGKPAATLEAYDAAIFACLAEETDRLVEQSIEIERLITENDSKAAYTYIQSLFDSKEFRNYGQLFEIVSFAVLKVYFEHFGFVLNRFSTTFSNDGGMDFIASAGIYQVTTHAVDKKILGDISKQKGVNKVLVVSDLKEKQREKYFGEEGVTDIITTGDLKSHFMAWLIRSEPFKPSMIRVLKVIQHEFSREL